MPSVERDEPGAVGMRLADTLALQRRETVSRTIESAALDLTVDATVEDIATAAGVSVRTLYNYFPTKEDILLAYPRRAAREMADRLRAQPPELPLFEALRDTVAEAATAEQAEYRRWVGALMGNASRERTARLALESMGREMAAAFGERAGIPADHVWACMAGAIAGAAMDVGTRQWVAKGGSVLEHQLAALDTVRAAFEREGP